MKFTPRSTPASRIAVRLARVNLPPRTIMRAPGTLQAAIDSDLGGGEKMKADFAQAGVTQFGSGWAWIEVKGGKLAISKTPNGENPLVNGATPILGCDVWEHSYYIDYRNRRPDYMKAFLDHLVNWEYVDSLFAAATK